MNGCRVKLLQDIPTVECLQLTLRNPMSEGLCQVVFHSQFSSSRVGVRVEAYASGGGFRVASPFRSVCWVHLRCSNLLEARISGVEVEVASEPLLNRWTIWEGHVRRRDSRACFRVPAAQVVGTAFRGIPTSGLAAVIDNYRFPSGSGPPGSGFAGLSLLREMKGTLPFFQNRARYGKCAEERHYENWSSSSTFVQICAGENGLVKNAQTPR